MAVCFCAGSLQAQTQNSLGTFTPYSMFGVGELARQGTTFNKTMGGIGLSLRDHRYINMLNPASLTARDTLAFMLDFGVESQNYYLKNENTKSAFNTFNVNHLVFSVPLYKKSALMLGLSPYSSVGYKFEEKEQRPEYISEMGDVAYQHYGEGGISQAFMGLAVSLSKNFFVGAQGIYYFGAIDRSSNVVFRNSAVYSSIYAGSDAVVGAFSGKFGLQYAGKVKEKYTVAAGATYLLPTNLRGDVTRYAKAITGTATDTIYNSVVSGAQGDIPAEFAVGISFSRKDHVEDNVNKWMVGFDYTYQDWANAGFAATPGVDFSPCRSSSYKFGFELTPDRYDTRYFFRKWTYRGGLYYEQSYVKLNGQQINGMGITFGISIPVFRGGNMLNFGIDAGQRGSVKDQLLRERYVMFQLGISLYDIWFRKMKYE